jgi:hypothetical protein
MEHTNQTEYTQTLREFVFIMKIWYHLLDRTFYSESNTLPSILNNLAGLRIGTRIGCEGFAFLHNPKKKTRTLLPYSTFVSNLRPTHFSPLNPRFLLSTDTFRQHPLVNAEGVSLD